MPITGNMNVELVGRGKLTLRQSDFITQGGEASIYKAGRGAAADTVLKIFTDPAKMRADRMAEKVTRLAQFKHPYIVNPQGVVEDEKHNPIGFYMPFVTMEPMSRVFTTPFRLRENFTDADAIRLVHNMREVIVYAHSQGATLVDANELNWGMVRTPEAEPRIIDVDSWQILPAWPARVIMPSIRDYHSKEFNAATDWFSWGVVSFQVFTGIHPYKGRHSSYAPGELEKRMRDNVSVFHADVHLNAAVRDFSCIPGALLDWYHGCFEQGVRTIPPSPLDQTKRTTIIMQAGPATTATGQLMFETLLEAGSNPVIRVWANGMVLRQDGLLYSLLEKKNAPPVVDPAGKPVLTGGAEIVRTEKGYLIGDRGNFYYISNAAYATLPVTMPVNTYGVLRSNERMFAITDAGLTELSVMDTGTKALIVLGQTWKTLPNSTEYFDGVAVQNALGAKYLVIPWGDKACSFVRAKELDDVTVVEAKAGVRFVSVVAVDKAGDYKKFEFCFTADYTSYQLWTGDTDSPALNIAMLGSGVCATVVKDGELSIFVPQNGKVNKIADKHIDTKMQLATWGDRVVYIRNGGLGWVRVKS